MSRLPIRVVKVGGSLFERANLAAELNAWLHEQPPALHVLIAGGGDLAECIRNWDARFQLGEVKSHWLCIEALSISAKVMYELLVAEFARIQSSSGLNSGEFSYSPIRLVTQWEELLAIRSQYHPRTIIFDLQQFLREVEPTAAPAPIPHTWCVTTDSLAARVAELIAADELVLLKSALPPAQENDYAALAAAGFVDQYFPQIPPRLRRITFCTLSR